MAAPAAIRFYGEAGISIAAVDAHRHTVAEGGATQAVVEPTP